MSGKVAKASLKKAIAQAMDIHDMTCTGGEELIPIGRIENFEDDTDEASGPCPYLIHGGIVYLTVACPKDPHSTLICMLNKQFEKDMDRWVDQNNLDELMTFMPRGDARVLGLRNILGCGSQFNKEPDFGFYLGPAIADEYQKYPFIQGEVGIGHESLHLLMVEAAAWLNMHTEVRYVLVVKCWPDWRCSIYFCERDDDASARIEAAKMMNPTECMKAKAPVPESHEDIKTKYGIRILEHWELTDTFNGDTDLEIKLDIESILNSVGFETDQLLDPVLNINLAVPFVRFFAAMRIFRSRGQHSSKEGV